MENREFDRQEHNMGGQPDSPLQGQRTGDPRTGTGTALEKNRFWAGALVGALVTAFVGLIVVGHVGRYLYLRANGL